MKKIEKLKITDMKTDVVRIRINRLIDAFNGEGECEHKWEVLTKFQQEIIKGESFCLKCFKVKPPKCDHDPDNPNDWIVLSGGIVYCKKCGIEKSQPPKWKPEEREDYYYIDCDGEIETTHWLDNDLIDENRYKFGNIFKTQEQAELAKNKITNLLKQ